MDTLKRWFQGKYHYYKIYSKEEADELGIKYVPWRDVKVGEWALSDDGFIGECLKIYGPYNGTRHLRFSFASVWDNKNVKIEYLVRKVNKAYARVGTGHWAEAEASSGRGKRFVAAYVMMFLAGQGIDWEKLGRIHRGDKGNDPVRRAKHIFKQEAFQKVIKQKTAEALREHKIDEGDVIDMFKVAYDIAKEKKDAKEMRMVTEDFRDMLDMLPEKSVTKMLPYGEDAEWEDADNDLGAAKKLTGGV